MLLHSDTNGPRLLKIITDQFLNNPRVSSSSRAAPGTVAAITDKFRPLWEEIGMSLTTTEFFHIPRWIMYLKNN